MHDLKKIAENLLKVDSMVLHGRAPIKPVVAPAPIIPQERWAMIAHLDGKCLDKTYTFKTFSERNQFIADLIDLEERQQHCAHITILELNVNVKLMTQNIKIPTNADKAMATYLDEVFRDVTSISRLNDD